MYSLFRTPLGGRNGDKTGIVNAAAAFSTLGTWHLLQYGEQAAARLPVALGSNAPRLVCSLTSFSDALRPPSQSHFYAVVRPECPVHVYSPAFYAQF